jgi:hypothetical protein
VRRRLFWAGVVLLVVGGLLMLLAMSGVGRARRSTEQPAPARTTVRSVPVDTPTAVTGSAATASPLPPLPPTRTPEPVFPTPTPGAAESSTVGSVPTDVPAVISHTAAATPTIGLADLEARGALWNGRPRWCVTAGPISRYDVAPLRLGWYLDWMAQLDPDRPGGMEYAPLVLVRGGELHPDAATVAAVAQANPGSLWLVGNEPDVRWQGNLEPAAYAAMYHEAYSVITAADPTAQVAIGGVAQPTPLRLEYLDLVLAAYREQFGAEMPIDVWNVHNFVLREERDSWGVDIPPGLPQDRGRLYEIEDNDSLEIFRQQIVDFRAWMAGHGYQGWPLIVTEYGIPMPADYGFPPQRVIAFLRGTFDFFLNTTDPALGFPADDYRLVQRWCWFSIADTTYPTGNLFEPATGEMTAVGHAWVEWVEGR